MYSDVINIQLMFAGRATIQALLCFPFVFVEPIFNLKK